MDNVLEAEWSPSGPAKGTRVFIPRMNLTPSDVERLPFTVRRRQFPVRIAFAMTINKSQGQTFKNVGVCLPKSVFSHGQLYVAFSRVGSKEGLRVLVPGGHRGAQRDGVHGDAPEGVYTANVVFRDVFRV